MQNGPTCLVCQNPATCYGRYEGASADIYSCDEHCGHGNEDGRCIMSDAPTPPEPTTAEAFATVREWEAASCPTEPAMLRKWGASRTALTLLRRRMGELEAAAREVAEYHRHSEAPMIARLRAALTDAPPVFTLEEVEEAMFAHGVPYELRDGVREFLTRR